MKITTKAYFYALEKHKGQFYGNKPFIYHPEQTAQILQALMPEDHNLIAAGFLHDILEDTSTTKNEIKKEFNKDIAELVWEVTKSDYNTFPNLKTRRGILLKFADRLSNLTNMMDWSQEQQAKYLLKSKFWKS